MAPAFVVALVVAAVAITFAIMKQGPGAGAPTAEISSPAAHPAKTIVKHRTKIIVVPQQPASSPSPAYYTPGYAQDISNAGISAPVYWINQTGSTLCADWAAGQTWSQTDSAVLLPGGIYPSHLALYDNITQADLCP
jgi:hypothetical protein